MSAPIDFRQVNPGQPYSAAEVASLFRVRVETVLRWLKAGHLAELPRVGLSRHRVLGSAILARLGTQAGAMRPGVTEAQWRKRCEAARDEILAM